MRKRKYSKIRHKLRSRFKLIFVWGLLVLIVVGGKIANFCSKKGNGYCSELVNQHLSKFIFAVLAYSSYNFFRRQQQKSMMAPSSEYAEFARNPEKFDGSIVKIRARVARILKNSTKEKLIRKSIDTYRTVTGNNDRSGRYIHQRFIVESPSLLPNETIIVYHNVNFGKIKLKKGRWLEIEGEYIHRDSDSKRNRTYGLIHYTHEPHGSIRRLSKSPRREVAQKIGIRKKG